MHLPLALSLLAPLAPAQESAAPSTATVAPIVLHVPDVQAAMASIDRCAIVGFLDDEEIVATYRAAFGDESGTPRAAIEAALGGAFDGMPEGLGKADLQALKSFTLLASADVDGLDLSVDGMDAESLQDALSATFVLEAVDASTAESWAERIRETGRAEAVDVRASNVVVRAGGSTVDLGASFDAHETRISELTSAAEYGAIELSFARLPGPNEPSDLERALADLGALLLGSKAFPVPAARRGPGAVRMGYAGGRLVVDTVHRPAGPGLIGATPVDRSGAELAHPEAWIAALTSIDKDGLAAVMGDTEAADALVDSLASSMAISVLPYSPLAGAPVVEMQARISDREAVETALAKIFIGLGEAATVESREYKGATLHEMKVAALEGLEGPLAMMFSTVKPTVAVTDDRILFATSASALRKEVRRLSKGEPVLHAGLTKIVAPEDAVAVVHVDWATALDAVYGAARGFAAMQGSIPTPGGELSVDDLPGADVFSRSFPPGQRWFAMRDSALVGRSDTSFDVPDVVGIGGTAAVALLPRMTQKLEQAEVTVARAGCKAVEYEVQSYMMENNGAQPAVVGDLTGLDPEGRVDPWGNEFRFVIDDSFSVRVWSIGPNGVDEKGEGDDVSTEN